MASRPDPGRAISEALCPGCVFLCGGAPGRGLRAPVQPAPQAGGGLPERICPVGPFSIVPRRLAGGVAPRVSRAPRRDGKAQSARRGSRRLRLSVRRWAGMRLAVRPHACSPSRSRRRPLRVRRPPRARRRTGSSEQATARSCVQRTKDVPGSQGNQMGAAVGILVLLILPRSQDSHAVPHGHISPA